MNEILAKTIDEPMSLLIYGISNKHWFSVITYGSDTIGILWVSQSRREEIERWIVERFENVAF